MYVVEIEIIKNFHFQNYRFSPPKSTLLTRGVPWYPTYCKYYFYVCVWCESKDLAAPQFPCLFLLFLQALISRFLPELKSQGLPCMISYWLIDWLVGWLVGWDLPWSWFIVCSLFIILFFECNSLDLNTTVLGNFQGWIGRR